jgi:ferritin-like metal-binding protein YciE
VAITSTYEKFTHQLGDIYDAELRFLDLYQWMAERATNPTFRDTLQRHVEETRQHTQNLEQVYDLLGLSHERETCEAAQGLVAEAQHSIQEAGNDPIRDWSIKLSIDRTDHYEIAAYQSLIMHAQMAGRNDIADLLQQNLQQEEQMAQVTGDSAQELLRAAMDASS